VPVEDGGLSIKVLGTGCARCERLVADVMSALDALGLAADVEHVTDPARIGEYGVMGTPALVVNGRIVAAGSAPSAAEIRKMLTEGAGNG
jgi:small redox-active disulfide protein 2